MASIRKFWLLILSILERAHMVLLGCGFPPVFRALDEDFFVVHILFFCLALTSLVGDDGVGGVEVIAKCSPVQFRVGVFARRLVENHVILGVLDLVLILRFLRELVFDMSY